MLITILCICVLLATALITITDAACVIGKRKTARLVYVNEAWRHAKVKPISCHSLSSPTDLGAIRGRVSCT